MAGIAHDVFVSYASDDKPTADAVCASLEARGIRAWIAPRDILPGSDWSEAIIDAIENARVMVLVFSARANASRQIIR
ncbi:MAG TPA: toll/interleukin-1 receptor domain-containing protein, partial [Dehalococcoidia bacterium]|nr:toll/interleukin-1 receptor domain-containing protein [Dehalococcoidia bacterium]